MTMQHLNSFMQLRVAKSEEWGDDDKLELKSATISGIYIKGSYDMTSLTAEEIRNSVAGPAGTATTREYRNFPTPLVLNPKTTG